jgi:hypothetical protein
MMMKTRYGILFSLVTLALLSGVGIAAAATSTGTQIASTDTIASENGSIGPGNSLYGLRIAFENLDESFTFNQSERLAKEVGHANLRLGELKQELALNRTATAEIALEQYRQKLNQTEETLAPFSRNGTGPGFASNETGLLHAQEMIAKHQQVLEALLQSHPDNQGLARAYNNSVALEQKFALKIATRHQYQGGDDNSTFVPPQDVNQTLDRNGRNRDGFAGNSTRDFPQNRNQSVNKNGGETNGQAANQTQDLPRQRGNEMSGNNQGQNNKGSAGNSGNSGNNPDMNTGNGNNKGNAGTTNSGNSPGNARSPGK